MFYRSTNHDVAMELHSSNVLQKNRTRMAWGNIVENNGLCMLLTVIAWTSERTVCDTHAGE